MTVDKPTVSRRVLDESVDYIRNSSLMDGMVALFLVKTPPSVFAHYSLDFKLRFISSFFVIIHGGGVALES